MVKSMLPITTTWMLLYRLAIGYDRFRGHDFASGRLSTQRLKDYLVQGYAINERRLQKNELEVRYLKKPIHHCQICQVFSANNLTFENYLYLALDLFCFKLTIILMMLTPGSVCASLAYWPLPQACANNKVLVATFVSTSNYSLRLLAISVIWCHPFRRLLCQSFRRSLCHKGSWSSTPTRIFQACPMTTAYRASASTRINSPSCGQLLGKHTQWFHFLIVL